MQSLALETVRQYSQNGYLFPLDVFDADEVEQLLTQIEYARVVAKQIDSTNQLPNSIDQYFRLNVHLMLPCIYAAATTPALLDKVESILGKNILLWSAEFFIKSPQSTKIVTWHQDLTYWGLGDTEDELTAWIALSDVTVAAGCMRFLPSSHKHTLLPHQDTFDVNNLLSRGQELTVDVDESKAVNVELKPGQVSFHHGKIFHASGPNTTDEPRIGLVLRFLTPQVKQLVAKKDYAMQVRGVDETNHWIHLAPPTYPFQEDYIQLYSKIKQDQMTAFAEDAAQQIHVG